ncbi:MAG: transposase, partial [Chloroflexota bacterium]
MSYRQGRWPHGRRRNETVEPPTIWEGPDDLWAVVAAAIAEVDPSRRGGRRRVDERAACNAVIHRLRSGCQGNRLPKEFPSDSAVHRACQRWIARGVLDRVGAAVAASAGIAWDRQVLAAPLGKARLEGDLVGPNPTDRGQRGTTKRLLVDARGGP